MIFLFYGKIGEGSLPDIFEEHVIVVRLIGGLGNQMFQYALGKRLAMLNCSELVVDATYLSRVPRSGEDFTKRQFDLDIFPANIKRLVPGKSSWLPYYNRSLLHGVKHKVKSFLHLYSFLNGYQVIQEKEPFKYDNSVLSCGQNAYLIGYWQNEKYFKDVASEIKKDFKVAVPHKSNVQKLALEIACKNSICVHIRRGDFVGNLTHGVVGNAYLEKAVAHICHEIKEPCFYIFSDDIEWCKDNLQFSRQHFFVSQDYSGPKASSHLYLMTQCRHFILSNSTFGWWAAWLAENAEKIVLAPKQWVIVPGMDASGVLPADWIAL